MHRNEGREETPRSVAELNDRLRTPADHDAYVTATRHVIGTHATGGWLARHGVVVAVTVIGLVIAGTAEHVHTSLAATQASAGAHSGGSSAFALVMATYARELGVALMIGGVVALLFEISHWASVVGAPLLTIDQDLREAQKTIARQTATFIEQNELLHAADAIGLISVRRRTRTMRHAIASAVAREDFVVRIVGRAHQMMLGNGPSDGHGWLLEQLLERLKTSPSLKVELLLADAYSADSDYRKRAAARHEDPGNAYKPRDTIRGIVNRTKAKNPELLARITIKLTQHDLPYAMVMTGERAFVEHYLPHRRGGATPVFEYRAARTGQLDDRSRRLAPSQYEAYEEDFKELFEKDGRSLVDALIDFVGRKTREGGPSELLSATQECLDALDPEKTAQTRAAQINPVS